MRGPFFCRLTGLAGRAGWTLSNASMSAPLLCRLGYHKFGPWENVPFDRDAHGSSRSPRREDRRRRRCSRCGLEHSDYSPQEGMQVTPPKAA